GRGAERARRHADLRRLRAVGGVRDRAAAAGGEGDGVRRGHERAPHEADRGVRARDSQAVSAREDTAAERRELLDLILRHSFERRRVVLSSGKESDFYLDLRATMMRPRGIELAGRLLFERLAAGPRVEAVGGMV